MELTNSLNSAIGSGSTWGYRTGSSSGISAALAAINPPAYDLINGSPVTWSETIVWGDSTYTGNLAAFTSPQTIIWGDTIVWGNTIVWSDTIVWGDTIVWSDSVGRGTNVANAQSTVSGQTIVWDTLSALTIVWGDTNDDSGAQ